MICAEVEINELASCEELKQSKIELTLSEVQRTPTNKAESGTLLVTLQDRHSQP